MEIGKGAVQGDQYAGHVYVSVYVGKAVWMKCIP